MNAQQLLAINNSAQSELIMIKSACKDIISLCNSYEYLPENIFYSEINKNIFNTIERVDKIKLLLDREFWAGWNTIG